MTPRLKKDTGVIICFIIAIVIVFMSGNEMFASNTVNDFKTGASQEVDIDSHVVVMPMGRILLIRNNSEYCALKFIKHWIEKEEDRFAEYESYSPNEISGNFDDKNIKVRKEVLDWPKPTWAIFGHPVMTGNRTIRCGSIKLAWSVSGSVYFHNIGQKYADYGIELAPTPWTDIKEVNVFDPRVKWYRYDEKRKRVNIPIDKLWEPIEKKEGQRNR